MESYRQYFKSLPCFITVQDRDFRIIDANDRFVREFGDFEGRRCYQMYKRRPEKCEKCPIERTFIDGQRHDSEELVTNLQNRALWVLVNTTPIYDESGDIIAVMEMSTDITELHSLQNQLRLSQERLRQLFEEVPCFISIQDRQLRIIEANRLHREAFGSHYGEKCYKVYKHRQRECHPCMVQETFLDGLPHSSEEVVTSQDGRPMNVLVVTAPIRNHSGEIESVIEMSTDITIIRQLQDKLTQTGLLISSISHGIRGLLNGLDGATYLVNKGLEKNDGERIRQGWEIAQRNIARIRSMVLDILYYAKDREPEWTTIDVESIIRELESIIKPKMAEHGIELLVEIDPEIGKFEADIKAIRSMLLNLLENALDACRVDKSKNEHRVTMKTIGHPDSIEIEIADNGLGMDHETRDRAFSLFFSAKGTEGTGLGLFIANKIAHEHGGTIVIDSELGVGTTMKIKLNRARQTESDSLPASFPHS